MILAFTHSRRLLFLLFLACFTGILFLSFVPNDNGYGYYNNPPPPPPNSVSTHAPSATDPNCDPFAFQTHLHLSQSSPLNSYYTTYDPTCKASNPLWLKQLAQLGPEDPPLEALKDKTVLFLGDSVDRFVLHDICTKFNGTFGMHPMDSYLKTTEEKKAVGGLPRSCLIDGPSGRQGLTLLSYFFYGYDEADMWRDKETTWTSPPNYSDRWDKFEYEAYPSVFGPDGLLAGTPAGEKGYPDLVIVNMGLWELARFDRLDEQIHEHQDPKKIVDPVTVDPAFVDEFIRLTVDFLGRVRKLVGDDARIRWRQMHTPTISSGPYFKDKSGKQKKSRGRFTPVKVKVLNEAASYACVVASEQEFERRRLDKDSARPRGRWGRWRTEEEEDAAEDGSVTVWPIGDLIAPWPTNQWLRDDIHPTEGTGMAAWGGGLFEYLARTPKGKPRPSDAAKEAKRAH